MSLNLQKIRWSVVMAAVAVTLAGLFGAGFVFRSQVEEQPLRQLYTQTPAVESYTIDRKDPQYVITVKLKDTSDLAATYRSLYDRTAGVLSDTPFLLQVQDHRDPQLEATYRRVNLYVQEALATGKFADMADQAQAEAAKAGETATLDVDNDHVYVTMHDGSGSYLYSVTDRHLTPPTNATGGGNGQ